MKNILSIGEEAIRYGERLGADEVEAYIVFVNRKKIILAGKTWTVHTSSISGLGVRIIVNKKIGLFSTSSLGKRDVTGAVKEAYKIAKVNEPDKDWVSLPTKGGKVKVEQTFDKEIADIEPDRLIIDAKQMINTVRNCSERLTITSGGITVETVETSISNSHKCNLFRKGTFASTNISVKAEEAGKRGISNESHQTRNLETLNCNSVALTAAERAAKVVDAKNIMSGKMPIVWRNKVFASALRTMFGGTLCADSVQKGRSPWINKIGEQIASENFNLVDDGLRKACIRTREFDDEGIPQQRITLLNHGVLQSFLYDTYTAYKDSCMSTGNSSRDYRSLPAPSPNNLILQPGRAKINELVKDVKRGLYLFETIGTWLSNPISGDISTTATNAFLIENGELTRPVKGGIVSGNFFDILLGKIEIIADDICNIGSTYSPSIRVAEMMVTSK
ncbi:MAG: TldD/PmbA family protein [Candidatus Bathyarchaeota archaeon]